MSNLIPSNLTTSPNEPAGDNWSMVRLTLLAVSMFSLAITTIVGNTVVIYALRTNRHLRTVRHIRFLSATFGIDSWPMSSSCQE